MSQPNNTSLTLKYLYSVEGLASFQHILMDSCQGENVGPTGRLQLALSDKDLYAFSSKHKIKIFQGMDFNRDKCILILTHS